MSRSSTKIHSNIFTPRILLLTINLLVKVLGYPSAARTGAGKRAREELASPILLRKTCVGTSASPTSLEHLETHENNRKIAGRPNFASEAWPSLAVCTFQLWKAIFPL